MAASFTTGVLGFVPESLATQFCVWVVTVVGSAAIVAFGVYFIVVVIRLARTALSQSSPATVAPLGGCPCGGEWGPVESAIATDQGIAEQRTCRVCKRKQLIPR